MCLYIGLSVWLVDVCVGMCVHPVCTKSHLKLRGLGLSEQPFSSCRPLARLEDTNLTSRDTSTSLKVRTSSPAPCGMWIVFMLASWQNEFTRLANIHGIMLVLYWTLYQGLLDWTSRLCSVQTHIQRLLVENKKVFVAQTAQQMKLTVYSSYSSISHIEL